MYLLIICSLNVFASIHLIMAFQYYFWNIKIAFSRQQNMKYIKPCFRLSEIDNLDYYHQIAKKGSLIFFSNIFLTFIDINNNECVKAHQVIWFGENISLFRLSNIVEKIIKLHLYFFKLSNKGNKSFFLLHMNH